MLINKVQRKSMNIRFSGRSSDYITPSFGHGCLYSCDYCFMRRHKPTGLSIAKNTDDILHAIKLHSDNLGLKIPNQTSSKYWTYDISCNEDFALHAKYHEWKKIFDFFKNNDNILGTFATKYVNLKLLEFNPKNKMRIRFSIMPEWLSAILEPNTSTIQERISSINTFIEAGYEVHLNFSPVIVYKDGLNDYKELFKLIDSTVKEKYKPYVKAEVIFLTHNEKLHNFNLLHGKHFIENILYRPELQESKISKFGGNNIRYKHELKRKLIFQWKKLHDEIISWNTIRYIF